MRILIEVRVHQAIESFYDAAILRHWHTLSFDTVESKKNRLYEIGIACQLCDHIPKGQT